MAEVELDLAMPGEARKHLEECRESTSRLSEYIESHKLKVPPAEQFESRIKDAFRRLQLDHGAAPLLSTTSPRNNQP